MGHPLLPDLDATIEVDPREATLELHGDEALLAEYRASPGDRVLLKVGYIKPAKFTSIRFNMARLKPAKKSETGEVDYDFSEGMVEVYREICRWAIKGWNIEIPFPTDEEEVRGRKVKVASEPVIEAIEAKGWLHAVAIKALEFNTLGEDTKKKSS